MERLEEHIDEFNAQHEELIVVGYVPCWINGSSKPVAPHASIAGYRFVCFESDVLVAKCTPLHFRQKNDTAKLYASMWVVKYSTYSKYSILLNQRC